jgi:hypothetical protein
MVDSCAAKMAFEVMEIAGVSLSALRAENPALCGGAVGWIAGFASRFEEELDGSRGDGANVRFAAAKDYPTPPSPPTVRRPSHRESRNGLLVAQNNSNSNLNPNCRSLLQGLVTVGFTFAFNRNRFFGSYLFLTCTSRSWLLR